MKAIKIVFLGLTSLFSLGSGAQNVEQIYMKSGSVVEGYISEQIPGKEICIQTTKATIVVNSDSLQERIIERMPLESLPEQWKEWAVQNNKFIEHAGVKQLELSTLKFNDIEYSNVFLLERGSMIKFLDLLPNKYRFVWGDMYRTVKNKRPDNLFSGVKEILILNDNSSVEGQIIEQYPGKDLKIETISGEVLSYKFSNIKKIITTKLNDKFDLWSQVQFLDRITVKGENMPIDGFISSRTLSKEFVIEFEDGTKRTIALNKIISYAKIPNEKYVAAYDKELKVGEVLLNGTTAYFDNLKVQDSFLLLGENVSAQLTVGETVCIEAKLANTDTSIALVKAYVENIATGKDKDKKPILWPVITYQDLVQSHLAMSREITPLGNVKVTFEVNEPGDYVLYIQGMEGYIVINVIENQ